MDNDILGLQAPQQQTPQQTQQQADFSFTSLQKEIDDARDQALYDNLAGKPVIAAPHSIEDTNITAATDVPEITDSFTTRDEVMAKLGLMKEDYSYTDTYTNYIQNGGTPLPGYESAHTEILAQERAEALFKQEDEGLIDHDTALIEAYGRDILATMGYDVTSVAYWQNKFLNNDFSHPFNNRYLMDQVLNAAEEYKKTREASAWGKSSISNTQIASLAGEELSAKQIKQIFGDIGKYAEEQRISDEDLLRQCLSGSLSATSRLRQIDETHFAFLHTDGELHILEKGKDIIFDTQGNVKEISVNGSGTGDFLDHFASSFLSIVPTVVKLGDFFISIPDVVTGNMDAVAERLEATDAWFNSESPLAEFHRLDHVDLDGFNFEVKDIMMTTADITGMLAGNWCVGKIAGVGQSIGQDLITNGLAEHSIGGFAKAGAGYTLKTVSTLGLRSTGWYAGFGTGAEKATSFALFGQQLVKPSALGMWLNYGLKVAPVYFMKDFNQSVQQMQQTNISLMLQGKQAAFTEDDIKERALKASFINAGLNLVFSSAQGATAMERWGLNKQTENWDIIRSRYTNAKLNSIAAKLVDGIESPEFKRYMMANNHIIGLNSLADVFSTIAGNQIQGWATAVTKDGKAYNGSLTEFLAGDDELGGEYANNVLTRKSFWKDLAQSSIMQVSEYARNKRAARLYYYSGISTLSSTNTRLLQSMKNAIDTEKDPKIRADLQVVYNDYLNTLNSTDSSGTPLTIEQKMLKAMDQLCKYSGGMPPKMVEIFDDEISKDQQAYFKLLGQTIEYGRNYYKEHIIEDKQQAIGDRGRIARLFAKSKTNFSNYLNGLTKGDSNDRAKEHFIKAYDTFQNTTMKDFYKHTLTEGAYANVMKLMQPENIDFSDAVEVVKDYAGTIQAPDQTETYPTDAYVVYRIKNEAQISEGSEAYDQPRLKGKVFKTTMETLQETLLPGAVIKIDENTFAMFNAMDPLMETTALQAQAYINHSLLAIKKQPIEAAHTLMATLLGDDGYKSTNFQDNYDSLKHVLARATENGVLKTEEAADVIWAIANDKSQDKIRRDFSEKFYEYLKGRVFEPVSGTSLREGSDIEEVLRIDNALDKLSTSAKGSKEFNAAFAMLFPEDEPLDDTVIKTLRYRESTNPALKGFTDKLLQEVRQGTAGGRFPLGDTFLKNVLNAPVDTSEGVKEWTEEDKKIALYSKISGDKSRGYAYTMFVETDKILQNYDKNTTEHTASGSIVSINLGGLSGEAFHKVHNIYKAKVAAKENGMYLETDSLRNNPKLISEYKTKADIADKYGSTIISFDLTDRAQFESFREIAKELELFGDKVSYDNLDLETTKNRIRGMRNGWENDVEFNDGLYKYLKIDDKIQSKLARTYKDFDWSLFKPKTISYSKDGSKRVYDLPDKIAQVAEIHKVSNNVQRRRVTDDEGVLKILTLPFGKKKKTSTYVGLEQQGQGSSAKRGMGAHKNISEIMEDKLSSADEYTRDREIGVYYFTRNLIDKADPITYRFSYYGDKNETIDKLTKAEIIGSSGFYEIDWLDSPEGMVTIKLKDNAKDAMLQYLETSKDFNMFKIIPLISNERLGSQGYLTSDIKDGVITYVDKEGNLKEAQVPDMYHGNSTYQDNGLQQIYNIAASFDEDGTVKSYILGSLAEQESSGNYTFNPFVNKIVSSQDAKQEIYNAYINKDIATLSKFNDYEALYLKALLETEEEFNSDNINEDHKVLLQNDKVVKYLQKHYNKETGEFDLSFEDIKTGVKNTYIGSTRKQYKNASTISYDFDTTPYSSRRYSQSPDAYAVNSSVLNRISGQDYYIDLENPASPEYLDTILSDAVRTFQEVASAPETHNFWAAPDTVNVFQESDVGRILQGISGNEGYIKQEDLDYIINMDAEARKLFADAAHLSDKEVDSIVSSAKKLQAMLINIDEKNNRVHPREYKQFTTDVSGASKTETAGTIASSNGKINDLQRDLLKHHNKKDVGDRLVDAADILYEDNLNELKRRTGLPNEDTAFLINYYNKEHDDQIRRKFDSPQTAEIYNMESVFGVDQMAEIRLKTLDKVKQITDDEEAQANIVADMYYSSMQFTRDNEYQQYKIYDKHGSDILSGAFNGKDFFEVYTKLNKFTSEDIKDATFVELKRHSLDSYDGVDFAFAKLDNETLDELKNQFLIRAIEQYSGTDNFEQVRNELLSYQENDKAQFEKVMYNLALSQTSKQTKRERILKNVSEKLHGQYSDKQILDSIIPSIISNRAYGNEGINNYFKSLGDSLDSNNQAEVTNASLALFSIDFNSLSQSRQKALSRSTDEVLRNLQNSVDNNTPPALSEDDVNDIKNIAAYNFSSDEYKGALENFLAREDLTPDKKIAGLKALVALSKDASMLSYRTSGIFSDTLRDRNKLASATMPYVEYTTSDGVEGFKKLNELDTHNFVHIDLESLIGGENNVVSKGTLYDVFQASVRWYNSETDEWEHKNIFITHGMEPSEYNDVAKLTENSYYKTKEGYKTAVDQYLSKTSGGDTMFLSEDEFKKFVSQFEGKTIMAFNGENFDFKYIQPYIKNAEFLDASQFNNITDADSTAQRKQLELLYARDLGDKLDGASRTHNADTDTSMQQEWVENRINSYVDPAINSKQRFVRIVDDYIMHAGLEEYKDEIYKELDKTFSGQYNMRDFKNKFIQGMTDASTTTYLVRQMNHLNDENVGYAINSFLKDNTLYADAGFTAYKDAILNGKLKRNVINAVAEKMLSDESLTAAQALRILEQEEYNAVDKGTYVNAMLNIANREVDPSVSSSEDFKHIVAELNKKGQRYGTRYSFVDRQDTYNRIKTLGIASTFNKHIEEVSNAFTFDDVTLKDWFEDQAYTLLSGTEDGLDQFNYTIQEVINSRTADKTLEQLQAIAGGIKGTLYFNKDGVFKRVLQGQYGEQVLQTLSYNPKNHYLTTKPEEKVVNIDSTTIVMDRKAFTQMCRNSYDNIFDEEGNAYVTVLRQPSAFKGSKQYFKVQVVEGNRGDVYITPAIWRSLFAGDFDGDSASIVPVDTKLARALAKFSTEKLNAATDIQESLYQDLTTQDVSGKIVYRKRHIDKDDYMTIMQLSREKEIYQESVKLDKQLQKIYNKGLELTDAQYDQMKEDFLKTLHHIQSKEGMSSKIVNLNSEQVWDALGVKRGNGYAYVNNWELLQDPDSFAFRQTLLPNMVSAADKTNDADSMAGFYKQRYLYGDVIKEGMELDPLKKVDIYGSRIGEELGDFINHVDWNKSGEQALNSYFDTMKQRIANLGSYGGYDFNLIVSLDDIKNSIKDTITSSREAGLSSDEINDIVSKRVFATTYQTLVNINNSLRDDPTLNDELSTIFKTIDPDDSFRDQLDQHLKFNDMIKKLSGSQVSIAGSSIHVGDDATIEDLIFREMNKQTNASRRTSYIKSWAKAFGDNSLVTVAVIDDNGLPIEGAMDTLFVNNKTSLRHIKESFSLSNKQVEMLYKITDGSDSSVINNVNKGFVVERLNNLEDSQDKRFLQKVITNLNEDQDLTLLISGKNKNLLLQESVIGKKGLALGKGMIKGFEDANEFTGDQDIDLVMNSVSRLSKISPGTVFGPVSERRNISIKIGKNAYVNRTVKIFKGVPFKLLEDFNNTVDGRAQKTDLMTILAQQGSLVELGDIGSVVLKKEKNGSITYDNSEIAGLINKANVSKNVAWNNGIGLELIGRNIALKHIISKENLWSKFNNYVNTLTNTDYAHFNNGADFDRFIMRFSPASLEMYNISESLTRFLTQEGYSTEDLLSKMNDQERACFSKDVQDYLDYTILGRITDSENPWITSKHQAHSDVTPFRNITPGERINPSQEEYSGQTARVTSEYFYMPMNNFYANHNNGFAINKYDALDLTRNGLVSYTKHYPASFIAGFAPIADTRYAFELPKGMMQNVYMIDPKSGATPKTDRDVKFPLPENVFGMQGVENGVGPLADNRSRGRLNISTSREALNAPYKFERDGALLNSLINKDNIPEALADASTRHMTSDIVLNIYKQKRDFENGNLVYKLKPETYEGTYSYLTGKGNDFIKSKYSFYTMKDIFNNLEQASEAKNTDISKVPRTISTSKISKDNISDLFKGQVEVFANAHSRITDNLNTGIEFEYGRKNIDVFKNSYLQSQGIHIDPNDSGDTISISMGLENSSGEANLLIANGDEYLSNIKNSLSGKSDKSFENYCVYEGLKAMEARGEDISEMLNFVGASREYYETAMKADHDMLANDANFMSAMNTYVNFRETLNQRVYKEFNDPFAGMSFNYLTSYVPNSKNKNIAYGKIHNAIINTLNFQRYSPQDYSGTFKSNMMFNFFDANKSMHTEIAKMLSITQMSDIAHQRGMLDNVEVTNALTKNLSDYFDTSKIKYNYDDVEHKQIHDTIVNVVRLKTDIDVDKALRLSRAKPAEQISMLWGATSSRVEELRQELQAVTGKDLSYSDIKYRLGTDGFSRDITPLAQKTYDTMTAQIIVAQRMMEISPDVAKNVSSFINSVYSDGYCFTNKWCQKLERGSHIVPIGFTDSKYIVDNIEIAANSHNQAKWEQYLLELALRGELYKTKTDFADQVAEKLFTKKTDNWFLHNLKKISGISASIQMAMPLKMMSRVARFTGTDYNLAATYSFKTIPNMARAAKELSAAIYSKGASVQEGSDLYDYLIREGQPLNVTNKDPITFQENIPDTVAQITDKMTKPLAYQNHLGRYAIWLTAKESFDNDDPIYGPTYYLHKQIDNLADNRDKATFIMDHMIGSPGGFPYLSKKTNGLMMFATFPMNLTRTFGAYGMSLSQLFQEGYTSENAPQWARTIASPSASVLIGGAIAQLFIGAICDKYNVDEKTKKKWIDEQVTIDPLATILGGTPSVTFDSLNPLNQLKELYVNPWTSEYNRTLGSKAEAFLSQNVISKLNPALKIPTEVALQKDFGSSAMDQSSNYTRYENGMRKLLGFLVGSGVANSVVDQFKVDAYAEDTGFVDSLWKGITRGFSNDLGNQKSWKKDVSNYYSIIDRLSNYKYATSTYKNAEYSDLTDVNYMRDERKYQNSYGDYSKEDYDRVNKMLRKMIKNKENPTTVYTYIAEEYNKGTSEATLRRALNNNSLVRMINSLNKKDFYRTLSSKELQNLEKALLWEQSTYDLLKDFFPSSPYYNYKLPNRKKYYNNSGSGYTPYPRTVYPRTIPGMYPSNGYSNKKYYQHKPSANIERIDVNVSPQMGVWVRDYDKVTDLRHWTNNNYQKQKPLNHGGGK